MNQWFDRHIKKAMPSSIPVNGKKLPPLVRRPVTTPSSSMSSLPICDTASSSSSSISSSDEDDDREISISITSGLEESSESGESFSPVLSPIRRNRTQYSDSDEQHEDDANPVAKKRPKLLSRQESQPRDVDDDYGVMNFTLPEINEPVLTQTPTLGMSRLVIHPSFTIVYSFKQW